MLETTIVKSLHRYRTSIDFTRGEDNHPDARLGVLFRQAIADVQGQRPIEEDGQKLKANDTL